MSTVTYPESIVVGLLQGVSELFPVSSLGHSVLLPAWIGGRWAQDLSMASKDSPYLSILVAMHVATALALVVYFWADWRRLLVALVNSIRHRRISTPHERLIWLMIVASIPVGLVGLAADALRSDLGAPVVTAVFLALNGVLLYSSERLRRRDRRPAGARTPAPAGAVDPANAATVVFPAVGGDLSARETEVIPAVSDEVTADVRLSKLSVREAMVVGAGEILGLLPGFSRSGGMMAVGLLRGLRHGEAARFSFLMATPAILGAGLLKIPALFTPANHAVLGPALAGSVVAGIAAYIAVRFLTSYFETRTLTPFAIYSVVAGVGSLVYFLA
jgi:undecaprenyl-diphosphatase